MNENYKVDIVVGVTGDEQAKQRLTTMERHANSVQNRMRALQGMKVAPQLSLTDRITPHIARIRTALVSLAGRSYTVTIRAVDRASGVIRSVYNNALSLLSSPMVWLGAAGGIAGLIGYPLKLAGDMMEAMTGFEFFLGGRGKAEAFNERLIDFAAKTPFQYPNLRGYAAQLLGTGMSESMVFRTLSAFGDTAGLTGVGDQGMKMALLGFRQMGMIGTVMMEELRQVTENLLIPVDKIVEKLGLTKDDLKDIGRLGIEGARGQEAILQVMEENYRGGMMLVSRQWKGLMSTIKDFMNLRVFQAWGDGIAEAVMPRLSDLTDWLSGTDLKLKRMSEDRFVGHARMREMLWAEPEPRGFGAGRTGVERLASDLREIGYAAGEWAVKGVEAWVKAYNDLGEAMAPADKFAIILGQISDQAIVAVAAVGARLGFEMAKAFIKAAASAIAEDPFMAILLGLATPGPIPLKVLVTTAVMGVGAAQSNASLGIPEDFILRGGLLGTRANGGMVDHPVIAGEDGTEAIVPVTKPTRGREVLAQAAAAMGIGGQIAVDLGGINVYVNDLESDESALAIGRVFLREISEYLENRA